MPRTEKTVITKTERHVDKNGTVTVITRTEEVAGDGSKTISERTTTNSSSTEQTFKGDPKDITPSSKGLLFQKLFGDKTDSRACVRSTGNDDSSTSSKTTKREPGDLGAIKGHPTVDACRKQILKQHNDCRAKHGVPSLKLNSDLCKHAQDWAEHLAASNTFQHSKDRQYGENIYMGMNSQGVDIQEVVQTWYDEIRNYNFGGRAAYSSNTGHFTQMVWKASRELGVGVAECPSGSVFVVANYDPPGNVHGHFADNVTAPKR